MQNESKNKNYFVYNFVQCSSVFLSLLIFICLASCNRIYSSNAVGEIMIIYFLSYSYLTKNPQ